MNNFQPFAVAMPTDLKPLLQKRIFAALLCDLWGNAPVYDLSSQEFIDLDALMTRYNLSEGHNMVINGRELSLLKRFLQKEIALARIGKNVHYWQLLAEFQHSLLNPIELVKLSFCRE